MKRLLPITILMLVAGLATGQNALPGLTAWIGTQGGSTPEMPSLGLVRYYDFNQPAPALVIDDGDAGTSKTGAWNNFTGAYSSQNDGWWRAPASGSSEYYFDFVSPSAATYGVYILSQLNNVFWATNARVLCNNGTQTTTNTINLRQTQQWELLGSVALSAGVTNRITMADFGNGAVGGDAVAISLTPPYYEDAMGGWDIPMGQETHPAGLSGNCAEMDGAYDYLHLGNGFGVSSQMCISVWVYYPTVPAAYDQIINNYPWSGASMVQLDNNNAAYPNQKFSWYIKFTDATLFQIASTTSIATNQWYHLAAQYDGVNGSIYVDGTLNTTSSVLAGKTITDAGDWFIGFFGYAASSQHANIRVEDLRIYSRALSPDEITTLAGEHTP